MPQSTRRTLATLAAYWRRFVAAHVVADDPHPAPSPLDRWDGR